MITFYADNLVDQATITPSTENLLFPRSNIVDPRRTKVFRSIGNTCNIIFDFQETSEIDSIFMVDNYKNGFGFISATLELNATSDFSSPAFTQVLTFDQLTGIGLTELASIQSYRFARLILVSTAGYCELSKIFIGKKLLLNEGDINKSARSISFGWTFKNKDLSQMKENRYGQKFGDKIARQKTFSFSFANLNKNHITQIDSITDDKGIVKPFFVKIGCPDMTNSVDRYSGMVFLNDIPQETNSGFNRFRLPMSLEEAM